MSSLRGDRCEQARKSALRRAGPRKTPGDLWALHIWRRYGLTPDHVAEMWGLQDGRCGVCGADLTEKKWIIDHRHVRGFATLSPAAKASLVRGLVCFFCNWKVLGIMERAGKQRCVGALTYLGWSATCTS